MAEIRSPIPGTFYRRPSPEEEPYKNEGDTVEAGDVVGLVEVMKSFIQVKSETAGKIKAFTVANEEPVAAGAVLVELED